MFVSLNIALCAVCAHATRSALRSEEKTRVCYKKEGKRKGRLYHFVSISLCLVKKQRGKHEKKDVKKGKRVYGHKVSFLVVFFALFSSLSKSVFFCSQNDLLVVKSNLIYEKRLSFFSSLKYFL